MVFQYFIDSLPLASLKQWNLAPGLAQEIYLQFILHIFCQGKKRSCLSGEYKQYVPVWILIISLSEKGYRNFPLGRMLWRFFSSCLVNFLQMYLSGYYSWNSLWKLTWHKCTMEANSHCGKILQIFFSWNEYKMFSYCGKVPEVVWYISTWFGQSWSFSSPCATYKTLGLWDRINILIGL